MNDGTRMGMEKRKGKYSRFLYSCWSAVYSARQARLRERPSGVKNKTTMPLPIWKKDFLGSLNSSFTTMKTELVMVYAQYTQLHRKKRSGWRMEKHVSQQTSICMNAALTKPGGCLCVMKQITAARIPVIFRLCCHRLIWDGRPPLMGK